MRFLFVSIVISSVFHLFSDPIGNPGLLASRGTQLGTQRANLPIKAGLPFKVYVPTKAYLPIKSYLPYLIIFNRSYLYY